MPSALPCAGAAPPQRPALSRHPVHSSPATYLANIIPPNQSSRGSSCSCPSTPHTVSSPSPPNTPVRAGLVPAPRLSKSQQKIPSTTSTNSPPNCSRPKTGMHTTALSMYTEHGLAVTIEDSSQKPTAQELCFKKSNDVICDSLPCCSIYRPGRCNQRPSCLDTSVQLESRKAKASICKSLVGVNS